jgi:branched-subunit amino acid aminotransferase/4-amino-4-deoxychorismate lyase
MTTSAIGRVEINGEAPRADDLRLLVGTNYGHFTSMQVERGCVRGLKLHLDRLVQGTRELFGGTLDPEHVRSYLRHAIGDDGQSLSIRVSVFSRAFDRERPSACAGADVLVAVGRSSIGSAVPMTVKSFRFERTAPEIKHAGTFPLFHYRRLAQIKGFDDALFFDQRGYVSEGSVWNVAFFDGERVVWPDSPQLLGVSMQLLQAGLAHAGIRSVTQSVSLDDIGRFRAAFFTNSSQPVRPIARIDDVDFPGDANFFARLESCYASNPLEAI